MAAAYAALVSLMHIIHDLQHHPSPPISLDKQLLDSITQRIAYFLEFLQSYNNNSHPPVANDDEEAVDPLEMRIVAAAYAAEDTIASHIVDIVQQQRIKYVAPENVNDEKIKSIFNLCCNSLQRVIEEMKSIENVVAVKVDADMEKQKALLVHDQVDTTSDLASVARNKTTVGSDEDDVFSSVARNEIIEKLDGGQLDFQVIPIVGMGGIGKTFLARSVYAQPLIKERFEICAWATISQNYDTTQILCELLSQATNREKDQLSGKTVDELGLELHKYLFCRRFFIVMDDMWSIDAWDKVQRFYPNNKNGSRVLVTTRLSQLCSQLNNNYSFPMSFLDEASSWDLFSRTVFGDRSCFPSVLKEIAENIVANCRGLPLSIVVVGGLLKKMDGSRASWELIRDNLSSVVNMENDKHCLRLLKLSYNHLPVYLKPCFLYMGVFEEDERIRVSTLLKLWVSEGFLRPTNGESLETTARGFLQDLIDRNLILIGWLGSTGRIKSCKMHDLVRDMCLKVGQKDGLYHVIGQRNPPLFQGMDIQRRRVVIPRNASKRKVGGELRCMPHIVRSVIYGNGKVPPFQNGLLRTIHAFRFFSLRTTNVNSFAFRYVNLRHLSIRASGVSSFLPCLSNLWNLHTLIVYSPGKHYFPGDFWKMPQFRHIEFIGGGYICLPDPPSDAVVIMENLHTLKGVRNFKCCERVVKRIPNIQKLNLRYDDGPDNLDEDVYLVGNIKCLSRLESLSVELLSDDTELILSKQKLTFPHSLKKLSLWLYGAECVEMLEKIGSLPLLEKFKLVCGRFRNGKWEIAEGQFPSLKYLELYRCRGLENWIAVEEGSSILPRLEHLHLTFLKELKKMPFELGNIDTLKSIKLIYCGGVVELVKEMFDEQVELQGGEDQMSFHVDVTVGEDQPHMLSFASPNFYVK